MCVMSEQILDCLKRKRDICIKNIIPSQNTAFRWTPALTYILHMITTALLSNNSLISFRNADIILKKTESVYENINNGKNEQKWFEWLYKRGKIIKDYTGWPGISECRRWLLTGWPH